MCACAFVRACVHVEHEIHVPLQDFGIPNFKVGFIASCGSAVTTACSKMDIFYDVGFLCKVCALCTCLYMSVRRFVHVFVHTHTHTHTHTQHTHSAHTQICTCIRHVYIHILYMYVYNGTYVYLYIQFHPVIYQLVQSEGSII